jgi:hypothetical protein
MEVSSSAITGALRVGIQVVVARKRPVLEIYQTLRNEFGPPTDLPLTGADGKVLRTDKHRWQDIFVDLHMVNVGGDRAEDVSFKVSGDLRRDRPGHELPKRLFATFKQFPPGQAMHLMKFHEHDLFSYKQEKPDNPNTFIRDGFKTEVLVIDVHYDGPNTLLNKILRLPRRWAGKKQYESSFTFDPATLEGDLPHPTYHG